MIGNRDTFRRFYPEIIHWTGADVNNLIEEIESADDPDLIGAYNIVFRNITDDIRRIKGRAPMVTWPDSQDKLREMVIKQTLEICLSKIVQFGYIPEAQKKITLILNALGVSQDEWETQILQPAWHNGMTITKDSFSKLRIGISNWEAYYLDIPFERILKSRQWKKPFDAIDTKLSFQNFSYPDQYAEDMYSRIARGHGWFGVGEWNVANRQYLNALATAIAINEMPEVENIVRFLVETYIASENYRSAINLMKDFFTSINIQHLDSTNVRKMLEAVIVGSAMNKDFNMCKELMERLKKHYSMESRIEPGEWEFVSSLIAVHKFRYDEKAYSQLTWSLFIVRGLVETN